MAADEVSDLIELIRRAQSGNGDAVSRLLTRYYDRFYSVVASEAGAVLRPFEQDDRLVRALVQKALTTALSLVVPSEVRGEEQLMARLASLAPHAILDVTSNLLALTSSTQDPSSKIDDLWRGVSTAEFSDVDRAPPYWTEFFRELVSVLSAEHRKVIQLREIDGMTWEQVAVATQRESVEAVKEVHARAISQLRNLIGSDEHKRSYVLAWLRKRPTKLPFFSALHRPHVDICFDPSLSDGQIRASIRLLGDYYRSCGGVHLHFEFTEESTPAPAAEEVQ